MANEKVYIPPKFINIKPYGLGGLVTKYDPQDLDESQSPDLANVILDNGYVQPRYGSTLLLAAPTGETAKPTQLLVARTSDGTAFMISVFEGQRFYLLDPQAPQWINITGTLTQTEALSYGSKSWNNNITDDRFYMGNGTDQNLKWLMFLSYLSVAALATDTTLTLTDTTHLAPTGTVLVNGISVAYTANAPLTGVLTLAAPVGTAIPNGTAVTNPITQLSTDDSPAGSIFERFQGRLMITGGLNAENTLNGSVAGDPENFTTGADAGDAFLEQITDGNGNLTDLVNFGQFLLLCKEDSLNQLEITFSSDLTSQLLTIQPLVVGTSVGPTSSLLDMQSDNVLYFPSRQNGIYALNPATTGSNSSTDIQTISDNIYNTLVLPNWSFANGRGTVYDRKLWWLASTLDNQAANDQVLIYDLVRQVWLLFNNWNAADIKEFSNQLYFISTDDGGLYFYDKTSYQDARGGSALEYEASHYSPRFDFGDPSNTKRQALIFLAGYIDIEADFYVDVLFNEGGSLAVVTYHIEGSNASIVDIVPSAGIGFRPIGQAPIGGIVPTSIGILKAYLDIPVSNAYFVVQVRLYSNDLNANWGVHLVGFNPEAVERVPPERIISHI